MRALVLFLAFGVSAYAAAEGDFSSKYKDAFASFERRGENKAFAAACAEQAGEAFSLATSDEQKYDALVLKSRCIYYVGMKTDGDDKKKGLFGEGKKVAEQAKAFAKDRAEAYFYYGINLGRWAEANGVLKSLKEKDNLRKNMEAVLSKNAVESGRSYAGKEYDSYGANRTLGRMYFKLPGWAGGDNEKAEKLLREAVSMSKERNTLNTLYLAEVLVANGKKAEAKTVLDDALRFESDPAGYNPKRVPETTDEMKMVRELRKDLGN